MGEEHDILGASVKHLDTEVIGTVIAVTRLLRGRTRVYMQWVRSDGGIQELWVGLDDVEVIAYAQPTSPAPAPEEVPA